MSAALYCSAAALQRKLSQDLFLDGGSDAWHDDAAAADDDQAEPPCFPDDDGGPAPPDHSLGARYAAMRGARSETVLFDVHAGGAASHEHDAELCRELGAAFSRCLGYQDAQDSRASHELLLHIAENTNYEVERVVRVMNRRHYQMQRAFAENYEIHAQRKVYHGTSEAGAALISAVGFKGAASRRAMFGKGVYTSPDVWNALAYAKPHTTSRQEVVAVVLLQGPTALGRQDQIDFGVDAHGSEILTLTNADGSILCAAKENQLLATHRFTLRYMAERGFMRRHRETVRIVHADIAVLIQQAKLLWLASQPPANPPPVQRPQAFRAPAFTAPASTAPVWGVVEAARALVAAAPSMPPGAFVAAAAALPGFEDETPREKYADALHRRFRVGDRVTVDSARIGKLTVRDMPGTVRRIVKARTFLICVQPDAAHERLAVLRANAEDRDSCSFLRPHERDLLLLTSGKLRAAPPAPTPTPTQTHTHTHTHTVLGKRQADADP